VNASRRLGIYVALAVALVALFVLRRDAVWQGSAELHTVLELMASLMALAVGLVAFVHYYSRKTGLYLVLGTAFVGTAMLDGYHTIATSAPVAGNFPSELPELIALSADAMPRQIEKGLAAGFVKYLTKPIDVDSFLEAIDEVLGDEPE